MGTTSARHPIVGSSVPKKPSFKPSSCSSCLPLLLWPHWPSPLLSQRPRPILSSWLAEASPHTPAPWHQTAAPSTRTSRPRTALHVWSKSVSPLTSTTTMLRLRSSARRSPPSIAQPAPPTSSSRSVRPRLTPRLTPSSTITLPPLLQQPPLLPLLPHRSPLSSTLAKR